MIKKRISIEQRLSEAQVAITTIRASTELQAALAAYGYSPERIYQGELLRDAAKAQYQHKTTAYRSLRDAALTDLNSWMHDLRIIARVALKDRPQLLEQIGVRVSG